MTTESSSDPSFPSGTNLFVYACPTTHIDWDWLSTFEEYYSSGTGADNPVKTILANVQSLLEGAPTNGFKFSLAEIGYLRRYIMDSPSMISAIRNAGSSMCFLGGGITSPDNQVSHGEAFIRNYLVGHRWLESVGLGANIHPYAWLPDDFGHDPQLPVVLHAMGMEAVSMSRIPGSPQPDIWPSSPTPTATTLESSGLAFTWQARDGSEILTHFMPCTYALEFSPSPGAADADTDVVNALSGFVNYTGQYAWPGNALFVPIGGDFEAPATGKASSGIYQWSQANGVSIPNTLGKSAWSVVGTFADYVAAIRSPDVLKNKLTMYAENYYTGYFASRPQLKLDHYSAVRDLLSAEALVSLLGVNAALSTDDRARLAARFDAAWNLVAATTHHDFVTGTSPDSTYKGGTGTTTRPEWDSDGQLAMSNRAAMDAADLAASAMTLLASSVSSTPSRDETPLVVFNPLGFARLRALVEVPGASAYPHAMSVRIGNDHVPLQRTSQDTLVFLVPELPSMGYVIAYLSPKVIPVPVSAPWSGGDITLDNGAVSLTLSSTEQWAISSAKNAAGQETMLSGALGNKVEVYNDYGGIYQFGNEPNAGGGFSPSDVQLSAGTASLLENGPVRWRFQAKIASKSEQSFTLTYTLVSGEPIVRMTLEGAAQSYQSIVTRFSIAAPGGTVPDGFTYGTSYHWEDHIPTGYWDDPIFRATHNFALPTSSVSSLPCAAIYHDGIPAWTLDTGGVVMGVLLRNTPGGTRAAKGTDSDEHTQHYCLRVPAADFFGARSGQPLRESLAMHTAPLVAPVTGSGTLPERASLAAPVEPTCLIRAAVPRLTDPDPSFVLRVQLPSPTGSDARIELPWIGATAPTAQIVTALEKPFTGAPAVSLQGTVASFTARRALYSLKISAPTSATQS